MVTCEFTDTHGYECTFLPCYKVGVGTRQASDQLSCKRHLARTCDELYTDFSAAGHKDVKIVVTPL